VVRVRWSGVIKNVRTHVCHRDVGKGAHERVLRFVTLPEGLTELPVSLEYAAVDDILNLRSIFEPGMGDFGPA
jgi:hypothetical protein